MLFPFRHSSIFRSRWMALLWAGGIIWFALDIAAPSLTTDKAEPDDQTNSAAQLTPEQQAEMNVVANFGKGG